MKYGLPTCYTPSREARGQKFEELYGDILGVAGLSENASVEIEAINPKVLSDMLHNVVFSLMDQGVMADVARKEAQSKEDIKVVLDGE